MPRCLCIRETAPDATEVAVANCPKHGTCIECDGTGYKAANPLEEGMQIGETPRLVACPYGCPPRIPEGQEALDV